MKGYCFSCEHEFELSENSGKKAEELMAMGMPSIKTKCTLCDSDVCVHFNVVYEEHVTRNGENMYAICSSCTEEFQLDPEEAIRHDYIRKVGMTRIITSCTNCGADVIIPFFKEIKNPMKTSVVQNQAVMGGLI